MSVSINISVRSPRLALLSSGLTPSKRTDLSERMGLHVRETTRAHLARLAQERHYHANALGASPTGFLAQAARAVEGSPVAADSAGATLTINHPGLSRAFRDVTITPKKTFLAIPINALAYGRRPAEKWDAWHLFIKGAETTVPRKPKPGRNPPMPAQHPVIFMPRPGGEPLALWVLVRSVTQEMDRTLLPSDEEWEKSAARGARVWLRRELGSGGAA